MTDTTKKPEPLSERGRVAQAYARVLGVDDNNRNEDQRVLWQDMERRGYIRRPMLSPDRDGQLCPLRLAAAGGMNAFHQDTALLVHEGCKLADTPKPKKRGKSIT